MGKRTIDTRIKDNLRRRLSKTLKDTPRHKKAHELLGCGLKHFKKHLESLFTEGMTWENYGEWHIDHIKMVSEFDKETPVEVVNSLDNLRPL